MRRPVLSPAGVLAPVLGPVALAVLLAGCTSGAPSGSPTGPAAAVSSGAVSSGAVPSGAVPSGAVPSGAVPSGAGSGAAGSRPGPANPDASTTPARPVGGVVRFDDVQVTGATDLSRAPVVSSSATGQPAGLAVDDLVTGTGPPATPADVVSLRYVAALYRGGRTFDSSWQRGAPAQLDLEQVVPGLSAGVGGGSGIAPMKVGGRRIVVVPAALGYGAAASGSVPGGSPLVFVVDLVSVS